MKILGLAAKADYIIQLVGYAYDTGNFYFETATALYSSLIAHPAFSVGRISNF